MHWDDIEEIAEHLEDNYSDDYRPNMAQTLLKEMITSLEDFEDQEVEVSKERLEEILAEWKNKGRDARKRVIIVELFR